jgi:amino acid permease
MFFGIAVFAFEGNGVIQSIHNSMESPEYFYPVLRVQMAVIISIVVSVATIGYTVTKFLRHLIINRVTETKSLIWSL